MPYTQFDRKKLKIHPLKNRKNKLKIEKIHVSPEAKAAKLNDYASEIVTETASRIRKARQNNKAVILAFGAHTIKNGLSPVIIRLMEKNFVTHLATNGAGIIHDWEFSFLGESGEDVKANVYDGCFGIWEETGRYINLAIAVGAYNKMGYGESVGAMIQNEELVIPYKDKLKADIASGSAKLCAAAADLLFLINEFNIPEGTTKIPHPWKKFSAQAAAYRMKIPFTGHPMFGHDIIYTHPLNYGAAIGRTAQRDFLSFAESVSKLDGGVYLSVGSAVMSPMIFEKAFSMAQNIALQSGKRIENHYICVVDLAESKWDWQKDGEPPQDNPAYYLRYCKTFSRMGGTMRYVSADNRDFLLTLLHELKSM